MARVQICKLRSSGGSLVLTIPSESVRELGWKRGDQVAVDAAGGGLRVLRVPIERFIQTIVKVAAAAPGAGPAGAPGAGPAAAAPAADIRWKR